MDGDIRTIGKPKEDATEDLSPETKRLIELKVQRGKLNCAKANLLPIYHEVNDRFHRICGEIGRCDEEIADLEQGQLVFE